VKVRMRVRLRGFRVSIRVGHGILHRLGARRREHQAVVRRGHDAVEHSVGERHERRREADRLLAVEQ
tara:strand:- start:76 stop:276 length:201 start_codon:yes stop_codon:yes gene_type:complete